MVRRQPDEHLAVRAEREVVAVRDAGPFSWAGPGITYSIGLARIARLSAVVLQGVRFVRTR